MAKEQDGEFKLHVPLDASGIKDFKPDRAVKAVVYDAKGRSREEIVKFDKDGKGKASFTLSASPGRLRVVVGPQNASAEQLKGLQTIAIDVSVGQWRGKNELTLTPIPISAYYWWWWFWWCREFKITGRVVCADGSPVPGATVCAYDVDWWWWWWSRDLVGCVTTDVNGAFEIDFVRCCGWWPWWWWEQRVWLLEPSLVNRISAILQQTAKLPRLPLPSPQPDPGIFQQLLDSRATGIRRPQTALPATKRSRAALGSTVDPAGLESLRQRLLEVLPPAPELEQIELWPWWPWWPWWDCDADIIFNVTQNCNGQNVTIVNETIWDTHWNIPNEFNVTLTANDQACCLAQCTDCPAGDCILVSDFCGDNVGSVGGNYGAIAVSPVGLLYPGEGPTLGDGADRPYAGTVPIYGYFGDLAQADYYELLVYSPGLGTPLSPQPVLPSPPLPSPPSPPFPSSDYAPLPVPAFGGFNRSVFVAGPPPSWPAVPFPVQTISDGSQNHYVIETISHYEANNGPQLWDAYTYNLLAELNTLNNLSNGTYYLQVRSWTRPGYAGNLSNPTILSICGTEDSKNPVPNYVVVTIDNQVVTSGPNDPYGLPCAGTVHQCTVQPETAILQVQIQHQDGTTTNVGPCDNVSIVCTDQVVIDFVACDPDAYLAYYTLQVTYGPSLVRDLLALAGPGGLSPSPIPPPWTVAAAQLGPDYGTALTQGASSPWWSGGAIRLTMNAALAFPETCAYELQLYAYKRTIGSCDHSFWSQYNLSELSFTIVNECPPPSIPLLGVASEVKK